MPLQKDSNSLDCSEASLSKTQGQEPQNLGVYANYKYLSKNKVLNLFSFILSCFYDNIFILKGPEQSFFECYLAYKPLFCVIIQNVR